MSGFVSGRRSRRRAGPRWPDDLREHVYSRITTACHLWPGITSHGPEHPGSVWRLSLGVWMGFAAAVDEYRREQKEASRGR